MPGEHFQWLSLEEFERLTPQAKNAYLSRLAQAVQKELSDSAQAACRDAANQAGWEADSASLKRSQKKRRELI